MAINLTIYCLEKESCVKLDKYNNYKSDWNDGMIRALTLSVGMIITISCIALMLNKKHYSLYEEEKRVRICSLLTILYPLFNRR